MCPFPIVPVNNSREDNSGQKQEIYNLLPFLLNPINVMQDSLLSDKDKTAIKEIWLKSESIDNGKLIVNASISDRDLIELKGRGLIEGNGRTISFTAKGEKILKEAILGDNDSALNKKASLFKKASKKLVAKNSYDFGDEVLIKTESKEKIGTKYISISKTAFLNKTKVVPIEINEYKIATRKEGNKFKNISDYSDNELIQILHLAKKLIANNKEISKDLLLAGKIENIVPIHRIKSFAVKIMEELNSR